jgi:hypothetical protein
MQNASATVRGENVLPLALQRPSTELRSDRRQPGSNEVVIDGWAVIRQELEN